MFNKSYVLKIFLIQLIGFNIFPINKIDAFVPYYNSPSKSFLKNSGNELGKNAYQLLYFGQFKQGLALAKLAISLNTDDVKLWALLAEAQISNKLYDDALISINKGKLLNPLISELHFAESSIYINQKKIQKAKSSLNKGLEIEPKNMNGLFQLGNIFLLEKDYQKALLEYDKLINIKSDFWQAINNKGLVYFELNKTLLAIENFKNAINIEKNAEPMLALAVCLQEINIKQSIKLAKEALEKNPKYVSFEYRKEQLWGKNLQTATEKLFKLDELKKDIANANLYKN